MSASRHLLSDKHRLDTAQLAAIYERHNPAPTHASNTTAQEPT